MSRSLNLLLLLWLFVPTASAQDAPLITDAKLHKLARELAPLVEAETGVKFDKPPVIRTCTRQEVARILVGELRPQLEIILAGGTAEQREQATKQYAAQMANFMLGKYAVTARALLVLPENFAAQAKLYKNPAVNSWDFVRVVVLHELVHYNDELAHRAFSRIATLKTAEQIEVWNAVVEGHAQFATSRILARLQQTPLFERFVKHMFAMPPGLSEVQKLQVERAVSKLRFAYGDGYRFFLALSKAGKPNFIKDVFGRPPTSKTVIMHPERYYGGDTRATRPIALDGLWSTLRKDPMFAAGWSNQVIPLDERMLRASCSRFVASARLDKLMKSWLETRVMRLSPTAAPGSQVVVFGVTQMTDEASAKAFFGMNLDLLKTKEQKLKAGQVRIAKVVRKQLAGCSAPQHLVADQTIVASGQTVVVRSVLARIGRYSVELMYSNKQVDDETTGAQLEKILGFLKDKK